MEGLSLMSKLYENPCSAVLFYYEYEYSMKHLIKLDLWFLVCRIVYYATMIPIYPSSLVTKYQLYPKDPEIIPISYCF